MKTRFLHKTRLKVWQAKSSLQDFECALTKIPKIISPHSVPYFAMIHQKCPCCIISPRVRATDLLVDKKTNEDFMRYGRSSSQEQSFYFFLKLKI